MVVLREFGTVAPDPVALCQQLLLLCGCYENDQAAIANYLGGDANIVLWNQIDNTWPPSYCLIFASENSAYLAIQGTSTIAEGLYQSTELNTKIRYLDPLLRVGLYWYHAASLILDEIIDLLPWTNESFRLHISGHSLGGAVASIIGVAACRKLSADRVQLMTFGQPYTFSGSFSGPIPDVWWTIRSYFDAVPQIPRTVPGITIGNLLDPFSWQFDGVGWFRAGQDMVWDATGTFNQDVGNVDPLPIHVTIGPRHEHLMPNYLGRALEYNRLNGRRLDGVDAVNAAIDVLNHNPPKPLASQPTPAQGGIPPELVDVFLNRVRPKIFSASSSGGKAMFIKHTWIFHGSDSEEWTESYSMSTSASVAGSLDKVDDIIRASRLSFLANINRLYMIRATALEGPKLSAYKVFNQPGAAADPKLVGSPDVVGTSIVMYLGGLSGGRRLVWYRGCLDSDINRTPIGTDSLGQLTETSIKAFIIGVSKIGYGILRVKRVGSQASVRYRLCKVADGSLDPATTTVTLNDTTGIEVGSFVAFSLWNKKELPGFNTRFEVLAKTDVTLTVAYTTPNLAKILTTFGRVRLQLPEDFSTLDPDQTRFHHFGTRDTRRSFSRSRGASRAKRLRHTA